jgi:hypothetical protein
MDSASLTNIAESLNNVAAAIKERLRHEMQSSPPPYQCLQEAVDMEALRLRGEGQVALADALHSLRDA